MAYHFGGRCVWIIGACFLGSSTSPTRTGVYTRVFHSVRPVAHCWHRSEKPWERKKIVMLFYYTNKKMYFFHYIIR